MKTTKEWVSSAAMAEHLGIHVQTLLKLRRSKFSPFKERSDYRWGGITTNGNLQWNQVHAEASFTNFHRIPSNQIEAYSKQPYLFKRAE